MDITNVVNNFKNEFKYDDFETLKTHNLDVVLFDELIKVNDTLYDVTVSGIDNDNNTYTFTLSNNNFKNYIKINDDLFLTDDVEVLYESGFERKDIRLNNDRYELI